MDKIRQAKFRLLAKFPFAGFLITSVRLEEADVEVAQISDSGILHYSAEVAELPVEELAWIFAHEVLHFGLLHHARGRNRNPLLWNVAADWTVNSILHQAGLPPPKNMKVVKGNPYENRSTETIYDELVQGVRLLEAGWSDLVGQGDSDLARSLTRQAGGFSRSGSGLLEREVRPFLLQPPDWRNLLAQFVSSLLENGDFSYWRPSRRAISLEVPLPVQHKKTKPPYIVALWDSSGSMYDQVEAVFGYILDLASNLGTSVRVIVCDTEVEKDFWASPGDNIVRIGGFGGSDFTPAFDLLREEQADCVVVALTDGAIVVPETMPTNLMGCVWVLGLEDQAPAPWGDLVRVPMDQG